MTQPLEKITDASSVDARGDVDSLESSPNTENSIKKHPRISGSLLVQYAKIGIGLDSVIEGGLYLQGKINSGFSITQLCVRVAQELGFENIGKVIEHAHTAMPNVYDIGASSITIISGGMILASGIYQLAERSRHKS